MKQFKPSSNLHASTSPKAALLNEHLNVLITLQFETAVLAFYRSEMLADLLWSKAREDILRAMAKSKHGTLVATVTDVRRQKKKFLFCPNAVKNAKQAAADALEAEGTWAPATGDSAVGGDTIISESALLAEI